MRNDIRHFPLSRDEFITWTMEDWKLKGASKGETRSQTKGNSTDKSMCCIVEKDNDTDV